MADIGYTVWNPRTELSAIPECLDLEGQQAEIFVVYKLTHRNGVYFTGAYTCGSKPKKGNSYCLEHSRTAGRAVVWFYVAQESLEPWGQSFLCFWAGLGEF